MAKRHYTPITADVEGVDSDRTRALIRKTIRTALEQESVTIPDGITKIGDYAFAGTT